jgi:hypothetical protein
VIKVILTSAKHVLLFLFCGGVTLGSLPAGVLWVGSKGIVKSPFAVSGHVKSSQSTCTVRNIGISTTSVVDIINSFRVNIWLEISRSLLAVVESSYKSYCC